MSLLKGHSDVYARRWENKRAGTAGYAPVCLNQWRAGLCGKPKIPCAKCTHKAYAPFDEHVIEDHLKGNLVAGVYPLLPDETCCFLAMDFDGASWQMDISMVRSVCAGHNIPVAVERSRSGKGGHIRMLEKMYQKRLAGYAAMGYKAKGEDMPSAPLDIIFDKDNFLPVFSHDIVSAEKEILIVSPFVRKRRTMQMMQHLQTALARHTKIVVVTRPATDYKPEDQAAWQGMLDLLKQNGITLVLKANIHQKFAIMDQKVVWYGSINLLSYGSAQESMMRIESVNIAAELMKSMEKPG